MIFATDKTNYFFFNNRVGLAKKILESKSLLFQVHPIETIQPNGQLVVKYRFWVYTFSQHEHNSPLSYPDHSIIS